MKLADAFAGIHEAQTPKRPTSQPLKQPSAQTPKLLSVQTPKRLSGAASKRPGLPLHGAGKSSHPDFEKVTIYVRRQTRKAAWRKWEDVQGGDFSDLMEKLLSDYLST